MTIKIEASKRLQVTAGAPKASKKDLQEFMDIIPTKGRFEKADNGGYYIAFPEDDYIKVQKFLKSKGFKEQPSTGNDTSELFKRDNVNIAMSFDYEGPGPYDGMLMLD